MKTIAVLTPNFNRANLLKRLYDSLEKQTSKNFKWYVVDDGSKEDPTEFIESVKSSASFEIELIKKENGGKHTCINKGIQVIEEPLTIIVDNDDFLLKNAIATIEADYSEIKDDKEICGLGYLKLDLNLNCVGKMYSKDGLVDTFINERYNRNVDGDKCEVFKTEILKKYPFPVFEGENFLSESTVWCKMALNYKMKFYNKGIYVCEYQPEGLSSSVHKRLFKNPKGSACCYLSLSTKPFKLGLKFKYTIAYIVYSMAAKLKVKEQYKKANSKFIYCVTFLPAVLIYLFKKNKYKD